MQIGLMKRLVRKACKVYKMLTTLNFVLAVEAKRTNRKYKYDGLTRVVERSTTGLAVSVVAALVAQSDKGSSYQIKCSAIQSTVLLVRLLILLLLLQVNKYSSHPQPRYCPACILLNSLLHVRRTEWLKLTGSDMIFQVFLKQ